jgi:hypothetical protein
MLMHGPAFDGSGEIIEKEIDEEHIPAYVAAGYVLGKIEIQTIGEAVEVVTKGEKTNA